MNYQNWNVYILPVRQTGLKYKYTGKEEYGMKKKMGLPALAIGLILCCAAGVTFAWLIDKTEPKVNTFTVGNIDLELAETTTEYKMVPGSEISKDPEVTVSANSEDCYVFVKVEESANPVLDDYITYTMADDWTALNPDGDGESIDGVYYCEVSAAGTDQSFEVLKNDKVLVKDTVTKEMMDTVDDGEKPTLTFTAYAVQKAGFESPAEAWAQAKGLS